MHNVLAGMFACQIWGTKLEQTVLCNCANVLIKAYPGVKRTTPNCNSITPSKVLQADVDTSSISLKCWTSDLLAACTGL
eukprot:1152698-Pelagomonas_calceolata.AAC.10